MAVLPQQRTELLSRLSRGRSAVSGRVVFSSPILGPEGEVCRSAEISYQRSPEDIFQDTDEVFVDRDLLRIDLFSHDYPNSPRCSRIVTFNIGISRDKSAGEINYVTMSKSDPTNPLGIARDNLYSMAFGIENRLPLEGIVEFNARRDIVDGLIESIAAETVIPITPNHSQRR